MRLTDHVSKRTEAILGIIGGSCVFVFGLACVLLHLTPASSFGGACVLAWSGWLGCSSVTRLRDG